MVQQDNESSHQAFEYVNHPNQKHLEVNIS